MHLAVIEAEQLEKEQNNPDAAIWKELAEVDGIIVPGGFDKRGIEGKILAAKWAREHNVPYFRALSWHAGYAYRICSIGFGYGRC